MTEITIPITKPVVIQQLTAEEWELFTCDHAPPGVKQATRALNTALVKAVKQYFRFEVL
jgi:hypothetical protein